MKRAFLLALAMSVAMSVSCEGRLTEQQWKTAIGQSKQIGELVDEGKLTQAEKLCRQALSDSAGTPFVELFYPQLMDILTKSRRDQEALAVSEKILALAKPLLMSGDSVERTRGGDNILLARISRADIFQRQGKTALEEGELRQAVQMKKAGDSQNPLFAMALDRLAALLTKTGRMKEAKPLKEEAQAIHQRADDDLRRASTAINMVPHETKDPLEIARITESMLDFDSPPSDDWVARGAIVFSDPDKKEVGAQTVIYINKNTHEIFSLWVYEPRLGLAANPDMLKTLADKYPYFAKISNPTEAQKFDIGNSPGSLYHGKVIFEGIGEGPGLMGCAESTGGDKSLVYFSFLRSPQGASYDDSSAKSFLSKIKSLR